jgi:hypothetical protein
MIANSATGTAMTPGGEVIEDDSSSGSDPDPDGMGEETDESSTTDTVLSQDPDAGIAKRVVTSQLMDNGCTEIVYEFNIENLGNVIISDIQVEDDLIAAGFGACGGGFTTSLTSDEFLVNPNYDGQGNNDLLIGTDNIVPGDVGAILLTVEACGCPPGTPIANTATLTGSSPNGEDIEDDSSSGPDPDPDGMGESEEDETDPTLFTINENPDFGVAKREVGVWLQDDGCALVEYEINVENLGDVNLANLQVEDDLVAAGFGDCASFDIKTLRSDDFIVNDGYDGAGDINLLSGMDELEVGDKGAINFVIEACGCPEGTMIANSATGTAMTPGGEVIEDESSDGADPDPDGNGEETDESGTTDTTLSQDPSIGSAKRVVDVQILPDGSADIIYEFNVRNYGNVSLDNIQLTDDLASVFDPCFVEVLTITSDDFTVNENYNGNTDINLLIGTDNLEVNDKGAILLAINVSNCGDDVGPFMNSGTVSGDAPNGETVEDDTQSGSDPDPDGNGDPTDNDETTDISFEFDNNIGIAKNVVAVVPNANGSVNVTYEFNIQNFGNQIVEDIQVTDNLETVYDPCDVTVLSLTSDDFTVNNTPPVVFDGVSVFELLEGSDDIGVGDEGAILLTINVDNCGGETGPFNNSAFITGTAADGTPLDDISQNGTEPDPDGDGDPTNNNDPTPVNFGFDPGLGVAKRVTRLQLNDDGCFDIVYEIKVENLGDVDLADIQVTEDLVAAFGGAESFSVTGVESEEFTVNTAYDGLTPATNFLLTGTDTLIATPGGEEGAIYLFVNVCPGNNPGPYMNTAVVNGTTPSGDIITDESTDGSDPDPNGDGIPDENTPTPVTLDIDPSLGLAKRLASIEMITDDCARVTYEFNIVNYGNTIINSLQVTDDLNAAFAGCSGDVSIFEITSDDYTVNSNYEDALATGMLLTGNNTLQVNDVGSILLTVDACTCGTSVVTNSATVTGVDPGGDPIEDVSTDGSDPDPNGDGVPDEEEPTQHTITCTVAIICPDVHDPVNVQNDLEDCGAIVNFPDAQIESNCTDIDAMDIQFMLTATDGTLPVTDPANGDAVVPYDVWITGQAGGLMYPVDTVLVTYRINPADLPQGPEAPILTPGECSFTVIVRDEQCPIFVNTMPEDTLIYDCIIPDPFVVNPVWHLRDNCTDPADIAVDFEEIKFDSICPNTFTLKRTWIITDEAGNACEHNHKLFVRDTTPPMIILPPDTTIQECAVGEVILNCRDVFTPIDTVESQVLIDGDWVITTIVIKDTTMVCDTIITPVPLTAGIPDVSDGACTDAEDILVTFRDSVDLVCKGDKAAIVFRIWRAEDECGNVREDIQEITIIDPNPPILEVVPDLTISLGPEGHVNLTRDDVVLNLFDACFTDMSDIDLVIEPNYFGCNDLGEHRVIVAATDPCNNKTAYEEVVVTIVDTQAPILNCPTGTITVDINPMDCDASFGSIINILTGGDCDVTLTSDPPLDAGIDMNTTEILVTAEDASGNTSVCNVSVAINMTEELDFESALVCNGRINVSLGSECWLELTPDQILEGEDQICSSLLCIDVVDEDGNDHLNFFDESDVNQVFRVQVKSCNDASQNSCWGEILIEEKQIPIVTFPQDTCIICVEPTDPEYFKLGLPIIENCELAIDIDYEDIYREFDECSDPRAIIERRWVVEDDEGNVLRDTQEIAIKPFNTEHVVFPEDLALFNNNVINCSDVTDSRQDIETGNLAPNSVLQPDSTGLPTIFGLPLQTNAGLCLFSIGYEDRVLDICSGSFQILRLWEINDVCKPFEDGTNPISHTQVITVYDVDGPQVEDDPEPITVSINPWSCDFMGELPLPEVVQSCGDFEFEAYVTGSGSGYLEVSGTVAEDNLSVTGFNIIEGTHWVTYVYKDGCSNIELFKYQLHVIDEVPPVALCKDNLQVGITASGTDGGGVAKLFVESVDAGSQDSGCGPIKTRCIVRSVDYDAGSLGMIDGQRAFIAANGCNYDGETVDTIFDKNGDIETINELQYVLCKDVVEFCCTDIGLHDVVLIVEDKHGNTNQCRTTVNVGDSSSVGLICLPQTIDCNADGTVEELRPSFGDFCGTDIPLTYVDESELVDGCGEGQIVRVWFLDKNEDGIKGEAEQSCTQLVTVINTTLFDPYTIKWPQHYTGEVLAGVNLECDPENEVQEFPQDVEMGDAFSCSAADVGDIPVWCNAVCGLVGVSSETDTIEAGDACLKLIKRWTVIDWCYWEANGSDVDDENDGIGDQFEPVQDWAQGVCDGCPENTLEGSVYFRYTDVDLDGYYTFDQVIEIRDESAPTIEVADVNVNTSGGAESKDDDTPCTGTEIVTATATDLCGGEEVPADLISWEITYNNDGVLSVSTARGATASIETQAGAPGDVHTISFRATDGCGNSTTANSTISFSDDKAPVPFCVAGVTTAVMESTGSVVVWAGDFDQGSFDNCSEIVHSAVLSGETPIQPGEDGFEDQSNVEFTCDDLSNVFELDIWVWDTSGNGDFCQVQVLISGGCEREGGQSGSSASISGSVTTEINETIEDALVQINSNASAEYPKSYLTSTDGTYAFGSNPLSEDYELSAEKEGDWLNGVSTLDLLYMQRHILGLAPLDSPHKIIAADVDNNERVNASDIVDARNVILGATEEFRGGYDWKFVAKDFDFVDVSNPWPFAQETDITELAAGSNVHHITGIKMGDVNGDVIPNSSLAEPRTTKVRSIELEDRSFSVGDQVTVEIDLVELSIKGMQFTLELNGLELSDVRSSLDDEENLGYVTDNSATSLSYFINVEEDNRSVITIEMLAINSGRLSQSIALTSKITENESYGLADDGLASLAFEFNTSSASAELYQNEPNPFADNTVIDFYLPEAGKAKLRIFDVTGKEVYSVENIYEAGQQSVRLGDDELNQRSGILYYELHVNGTRQSVVRKMIRLQ